MEQINENYQAIKEYLDKEEISYKEHKTDKKFDVLIDIWIAKYRIAIRKSQEDDQVYYKKIWKKYKPFFVRPNETVDFTLEKIKNCIEERVKWLENFKLRAQRRAEQQKKIKEKKEQELRAKAVKVVPGTKSKRKRIRIQKPVDSGANKNPFGPPALGGLNLSTK